MRPALYTCIYVFMQEVNAIVNSRPWQPAAESPQAGLTGRAENTARPTIGSVAVTFMPQAVLAGLREQEVCQMNCRPALFRAG